MKMSSVNDKVGLPYYDFVSDEPLEIIEANECSTSDLNSLATKRFRRAFNEIHRLRAALSEKRDTEDAARWRFGVEHGFPSHHHEVHPEVKPLGWRMLSQNPPNGTTFFPENYPYYKTAEQAIDVEMTNAAKR